MRYMTLGYKLGFVLAGFAQLEADVGVPSMFQVGWAKLWCLVHQVY